MTNVRVRAILRTATRGLRSGRAAVTSRRQFKKNAQRLGLTENELMLAELLEEMLEEMKWLHVLGYSNQFLLHRHLESDPAQRDAVIAAAIREVDKHGKLHEWQERLARIKGRIQGLEAKVDAEEHE